MDPCFPEFCSLQTNSATRKSCRLKWVLRITLTYTTEFINNLSLITSSNLAHIVYKQQQWYFMSKLTASYRENSWKWSSFSVFQSETQSKIQSMSPDQSPAFAQTPPPRGKIIMPHPLARLGTGGSPGEYRQGHSLAGQPLPLALVKGLPRA